jgi:hypothetical protein
MNTQVKQMLEFGLVFAGAVILLDVFLSQIQIFDWLALGLVFFLAAVVMVGSVAHTIPRQKRKSIVFEQKEDGFQQLADTVNAAMYGHNRTSMRILSEHLKSIALGTVAARTKLSKKEILELAEHDKTALENLVRDEVIAKLLCGYQPRDERLSEDEIEKTLTKIESWSH